MPIRRVWRRYRVAVLVNVLPLIIIALVPSPDVVAFVRAWRLFGRIDISLVVSRALPLSHMLRNVRAERGVLESR